MIKKLLLLLFVPFLMPFLSLSQLGITENTSSSYNGYTLFAPLGSDTTYLINNCGQKVHYWYSEYHPGLSVYLLENGKLLRTGKLQNSTFTRSSGYLEILDQDSNIEWSYNYNSPVFASHHDIEMLPNGNILILAWELKSENEAINVGRNPNLLFNNELHPEHIIEIEPVGNNGANIVWEWHVWDHLIQDFSADFPNYGVISEHPELININYVGPGNNSSNGPADWLHANSIDYNENLDQIIISVRSFCEFWIIDHSTTTEEAATGQGGNSGMGGDILYRWGNPAAYNQGDFEDQKLFFQHDAQWIDLDFLDGGKIMVFSNGTNMSLSSSIQVVNTPLNQDNSTYYLNGNTYGPDSTDWFYSDSLVFFSTAISGAQRLANGNTLICSGNQGRFFEVDYNGNTVWDYYVPIDAGEPISNIEINQEINNNVFRAYRYSPNYSGLINLDLEPQNSIEGTPVDCNIYGCDDVSACNYNMWATQNLDSCIYPDIYYDCDGNCLNNADDDEWCDEVDNCPEIYNPDQEDFNNDGTGDDCDGIGLIEQNQSRMLILSFDIVGGKSINNKGFQLHIYDDGSVEKKHLIK